MKHSIAELSNINSERKANSENSALTCSARPAKVTRKRSKPHRGADGARVGFGVRFRIASGGRALQRPGVGVAVRADFGDLPDALAGSAGGGTDGDAAACEPEDGVDGGVGVPGTAGAARLRRRVAWGSTFARCLSSRARPAVKGPAVTEALRRICGIKRIA